MRWMLLLALSLVACGMPYQRTIDRFDDVDAWSEHPADGVDLRIGRDEFDGNGAMRIDFDFRSGSGYAVSRRAVDLHLYSNYMFTFRLRAEAPVNTLEFKLIDDSGENVWWSVKRDYEFPSEWQRVTIKKRQISFAWGPRGGGEPDHIAALEVVVTSTNGGKGTVWVDDLKMVQLPPESAPLPPRPSASSNVEEVAAVLDGDRNTSWSPNDAEPWLQLDFVFLREFGGLVLDWESVPDRYTIDFGDGQGTWVEQVTVENSNGGYDPLALPESWVSDVRVRWPPQDGVALNEIEVMPLEWAATPNDFFGHVAQREPRGAYPRGMRGEQVYWTVASVDADPVTALIDEDGAVEMGRCRARLEPFVQIDGRTYDWSQVPSVPSLAEGRYPLPAVEWRGDEWKLHIEAVGVGETPDSRLAMRYRLDVPEAMRDRASLVLAVRPFQVNPPRQFLNQVGGHFPIHELSLTPHGVKVEGEWALRTLTPANAVGASTLAGGEAAAEHLLEGSWPPHSSVNDPQGSASGLLRFDGEATREVVVVAPLSGAVMASAGDDPGAWFEDARTQALEDWRARSSTIEVQLPPEAQKLWDLALAQLHYVLVNRNGPAIQPGTRSYARSWIRDGALTSSALLRAGMSEPAREFLEWFAPHQFENGKIPCVVDRRGPDPVPEHDSHGEFIFLVAEVLRYTGDRDLAARMWPRVQAAVDYMESLLKERRTPEYEAADKREFYGILPPSISHEGYSAKPMHSYWDDLFALRGYRDAVFLAEQLGHDASLLIAQRDRFQRDLLASIGAAMERHGIDYIPGCADLGDFDPTSTTILLSPVGMGDWIPREWVERTFERYWEFFVDRRDNGEWDALTPYELRNIGAFVQLGWRDRAQEVAEWFMGIRKPVGWMQWPEVVKREARVPFFVGDLPHTWVGTDFVRSVLDMFLYYDEARDCLVLGAGIEPEWIKAGRPLVMKGVPTASGLVSFSILWDEGGLLVEVEGDAPGGGVEMRVGPEPTHMEKLPGSVTLVSVR